MRFNRYDSAMENEGKADWSMEKAQAAAQAPLLQPMRSQLNFKSK